MPRAFLKGVNLNGLSLEIGPKKQAKHFFCEKRGVFFIQNSTYALFELSCLFRYIFFSTFLLPRNLTPIFIGFAVENDLKMTPFLTVLRLFFHPFLGNFRLRAAQFFEKTTFFPGHSGLSPPNPAVAEKGGQFSTAKPMKSRIESTSKSGLKGVH